MNKDTAGLTDQSQAVNDRSIPSGSSHVTRWMEDRSEFDGADAPCISTPFVMICDAIQRSMTHPARVLVEVLRTVPTIP